MVSARWATERDEAPQDDPAQLRLIADSVPAMSIAYDNDLRCLFANRRFAEYFGFTTRSIVGKHLREIVGEDAYREIKPFFDEVLTGRPSRYKRVRTLEDGTCRYLEVELIPHVGPDGHTRGLFAITTDATQRRREEQLRQLGYAVAAQIGDAQSSADGIRAVIRAICDSEQWDCGRYFQSPGAGAPMKVIEDWGIDDVAIQRFLACSKDIEYECGQGLVGKVWESSAPLWSADLRSEPGALNKADPAGSGLRGAFVFPVKADGQVTGVLAFNSRKSRPADEPLMQAVLAIGSQIGQFLDRKRADEALRESEARFRTVVDSANEAILVYDRDTKIISVNSAAERILGLPKEKLIGAPGFVSLVPCIGENGSPRGPEDRLSVAAIRSRQPVSECVIGIKRDANDVTWLSANTAPLFAAGESEPYGAVTTLTDISRLKRDEQLMRLEQQVSRAFTKARDLSTALEAAIRAICESENWDYGRYLKVDGNVLRYCADWSRPDTVVMRYKQSQAMTYGPGVGLVGIAWSTAEPLWVPDITNDARTARPALARELGARGALVLPVIALEEVIGVLMFQSRQVRKPDPRLLQAMQLIGDQIGQYVRRADAEEALRQSEGRFRSLCALSSDIFWEQDSDYRFTAASDVLGTLEVAEILGKSLSELGYVNLSAKDWEAHRAGLNARLRYQDLELCYRDKSGDEKWYSISGEPVFDASGAFMGYRGVGRDITSRKVDEKRIHHLAAHDTLTGLPNRASFGELLNVAIGKARRHRWSLAVMFIDLDRFKNVNDTLGHEAGDELLRDAARRLRETLRSGDIVARLGGDEFVALIEDVKDVLDAELVGGKILDAIELPFHIQGQECRVTASIGIALCPQHGDDQQTLMKKADAAMYRAKEAGKNVCRFYSDEPHAVALNRLSLESDLRHALERNQLALLYQPRIRARSGEVMCVEALLRWNHPEHGEIPPDVFIPLAEETGLIAGIGKWVLDTACAQAVLWQAEEFRGLRMAVNVSPRQFIDESLAQQIETVLRTTGLAPGLLEIELTESAINRGEDSVAALLARLRTIGVRVALDDFGTGFSSLGRLKRFAFDTLKVDRAFVTGLPHDRSDAAITHAIIAMGSTLGLEVVAEGVETPEQLRFLEANGCDELQGFLVSPPLRASECAQFLRRRNGRQPGATVDKAAVALGSDVHPAATLSASP